MVENKDRQVALKNVQIVEQMMIILKKRKLNVKLTVNKYFLPQAVYTSFLQTHNAYLNLSLRNITLGQ